MMPLQVPSMNPHPRAILVDLVTRHGVDVVRDPKRCEGLMRDAFENRYHDEFHTLLAALREGVPADLLKNRPVHWDTVAPPLQRRLLTGHNLPSDTARWSIETWALALQIPLPPTPRLQPTPLVPPSQTPQNTHSTSSITPAPAAPAQQTPHPSTTPANFIKLAALAAFAVVILATGIVVGAYLKSSPPTPKSTPRAASTPTTPDNPAPQPASPVNPSLPTPISPELPTPTLPAPTSVSPTPLSKPDPRTGKTILNATGMRLAFIPTGKFTIGSPLNEPERLKDETQQQVQIDKPFWMGVTEVTQSQWRAVMNSDPSSFTGGDLPVENISWDDANAFCQKLSLIEKKTYALPTQAQWEYACRAGTATAFNWGNDNITPRQANFDASAAYNNGSVGVVRGRTTAVAFYPANAWGLYDMHGNVWEWCADPLDATNRYVRGGAWISHPRLLRAANRGVAPKDFRCNNIGFRVVMLDP
jgi:formylglycine-generating enzyme required for sulfatase activity